MKEAIVLAGGLGTRLQSVVNDRPKCMAEVAGKPFLKYIFDYLQREKFSHVILSLGYKYEYVLDWLSNENYPFTVSYVIEEEPLGTGGAIKYAAQKAQRDRLFVLNGDTFFDIDSDNLESFHTDKQADITLALKPMVDFNRYGSVSIDQDGRIVRFNEKQYQPKGLINGGVYLLNKRIFDNISSNKFSFEKEVFENKVEELKIYGNIQDTYFIDIGIPSDYEKANTDFLNFGKW